MTASHRLQLDPAVATLPSHSKLAQILLPRLLGLVRSVKQTRHWLQILLGIQSLHSSLHFILQTQGRMQKAPKKA